MIMRNAETRERERASEAEYKTRQAATKIEEIKTTHSRQIACRRCRCEMCEISIVFATVTM